MEQGKIERILTAAFYLLAAISVITYLLWPESRALWMYCGFAAIGARLMTYIMRYFL